MEDSTLDDDDLKLQRASVGAIDEIKNGADRLLACFDLELERRMLQDSIRRQKLVERVSRMLDVFQEDPQLLDPHIKTFLPPLVSRFVYYLNYFVTNLDLLAFEHLQSLASIMYIFCKVRGEKVLVRFLDNEPKHLTPLLQALTSANLSKATGMSQQGLRNENNAESDTAIMPSSKDQEDWKLRYILLVWTGHLILTPFDLETVSADVGHRSRKIDGLSIDNIPTVGRRLVSIALDYMVSPTKERTSAASMLAKLALRPDMIENGLLEALVLWALEVLCSNRATLETEQVRIFVLEFIYRILRLANVHEINNYLQQIYSKVYQTFGSPVVGNPHSPQSAVATKFAIKVFRTIIAQLLQIPESANRASHIIYDKMMGQMGVLEEVIDFLLRSLADRDTQVRNAASKALSTITLKLDHSMAQEVVEAVIDSLNEDVLLGQRFESLQDFSAVNPLRWHGLTLTLSFLLFRRSPSPDQLGPILDALYKTLLFEQRSATGNSLGTNVRDAANFGLWSLARRYSTVELLQVPPTIVATDVEGTGTVSKIQTTANKLLCSACLDPSGNVRRGSSAALQELVGRHPDIVEDGIALVQIVDFQTVGLRRRAMIDVSYRAARLRKIYLFELLESLFGWRGLGAPDVVSRNYAAKSVGQLINILPSEQHEFFLDKLIVALQALPRGETEQRHGIGKALAEVLMQRSALLEESKERFTSSDSILSKAGQVWDLFDKTFRRSEKELYAPSARPELMTEAIVSLILSLSLLESRDMRTALQANGDGSGLIIETEQSAVEMLTLSLLSTDATTLEILPDACSTFCKRLSVLQRIDLARRWLKALQAKIHSKRRTGIMLGLASIWSILTQDTQDHRQADQASLARDQILDAILAVYELDNIDARTASIKSLKMVVDDLECNDERIFALFLRGLNDYTINERGDVGSLVRLEAIQALTSVSPMFLSLNYQSTQSCYLSLQRLALERLDKVRLQAAQCLQKLTPVFTSSTESLRDVSTFDYFSELSISILIPPTQYADTVDVKSQTAAIEVLLEGLSSSASGGSDSLAGVVRSSIYATFSSLPFSRKPQPREGSESAISKPPVIPSLLDISDSLTSLLKANLTNDRVLVPLLDLTLFLFDCGLLQRLNHFLPEQSKPNPLAADAKARNQESPVFKPLVLLSLIQKSHFKSSNLSKILTCVQIYRHLADVPDATTRTETLRKLGGMLGHPFSKVRVQVAEVLWVVTGEESLRNIDWSSARTANEVKSIARLFA